MPSHHWNASGCNTFKGRALLNRVKAVDDHAICLERQCLTNRGGATLNRPGTIQNAHGPANCLGRFFNTVGHAQNAAILEVTRKHDDGLALGTSRARCRAVPSCAIGKCRGGECECACQHEAHKCPFLHLVFPSQS